LGDGIEEDEMGWISEMHGAEEKCRQYRRGNRKEMQPFQRLRRRWGVMLKWILKEPGWGSYIGFIWPRTRTHTVMNQLVP